MMIEREESENQDKGKLLLSTVRVRPFHATVYRRHRSFFPNENKNMIKTNVQRRYDALNRGAFGSRMSEPTPPKKKEKSS